MKTPSSHIVDLSQVRVRYGFRVAVDSFDLVLEKGSSLGLLGANGAGKTTILDVILGVRRASKGSVRVFGGLPGKPSVLKRIGFAPEDGLPPDYLTAREYLRFVAAVKRVDRSKRRKEVDDLLEWFELPPSGKVGSYSKGMRRRLMLAQALIGSPELLVLDEPQNGLDALLILKFRQKLQEYLAGGGTLILSSHILGEVERVCSEVAILQKGKLVLKETMTNLVQRFGSVEQAFASSVGGE